VAFLDGPEAAVRCPVEDVLAAPAEGGLCGRTSTSGSTAELEKHMLVPSPGGLWFLGGCGWPADARSRVVSYSGGCLPVQCGMYLAAVPQSAATQSLSSADMFRASRRALLPRAISRCFETCNECPWVCTHV
jgi:hypothetical protein